MKLSNLKYIFKINYAKRSYIKSDGKGKLLFAKYVSQRTKKRLSPKDSLFVNFDYINPVNQCTHPDILKSQIFKGKYLLTVSGYPFEIAKFENPFLFVSDDGLNFKNAFREKPIAEYLGNGNSHYSDGEIIEDDGKVFLFYRMCYEDCDIPYVQIISRYSNDLSTWSNEIEIAKGKGKTLLSPAFVKQKNCFYMYYVDYDEQESCFKLKRRKSSTVLFEDNIVEEELIINNAPVGKNIWHIDIVQDGKVLRGLFVFMLGQKAEAGTRLYYAESLDNGAIWEIKKEIVFDVNYKMVKRIYRSTMVKGENGWNIYYPVCTNNECWYLLLKKNYNFDL